MPVCPSVEEKQHAAGQGSAAARALKPVQLQPPEPLHVAFHMRLSDYSMVRERSRPHVNAMQLLLLHAQTCLLVL